MVEEMDKSIRANATYVEWILDAVRKIKHQKQRPSKERIVNAIKQNHQVSTDSIVEQLELAVKDGSVIRVDNNGYTYKDPGSAPQGGRIRLLEVNKKAELAQAVVQCLEENSSSKGLMLKTIEKFLQSNYNIKGKQSGNLIGQLRMCVRKLVQKRTLQQVGKFVKLCSVNSDCDSSGLGNISLEEANLEVILPFERKRVRDFDRSLIFGTGLNCVPLYFYEVIL